MHDLVVVQAPVTYPYDGPRLTISPHVEGSVEFCYNDTPIVSKQWRRVVPAAEAFSRLERFVDQLHWFVRQV